MTVSSLRVIKSETRDMAERDRHQLVRLQLGEPAPWQTSNTTFFVALVAILAMLAMLALILR